MRINNLKTLVPDGAIFDDTTKHILTEDNVEKKLCTHCKQWLPLSSFYHASSARDNLGSWCIDCHHNRVQEMQPCKKSRAAQAQNNFFDDLKKSLSKVRVSLKDKDAEIAKLKTEIETLRNKVAVATPTELSSKQVEDYLLSHNVSPRVLLSAVARQDSRYKFIVHDTITGLTSTVKVDVD